jgi:CHAT domain-containing protein
MKTVTSLLLGLLLLGQAPVFSQKADTLAARRVLNAACQQMASMSAPSPMDTILLDTALVALRLNAGASASLEHQIATLLDSLGKRLASPRVRLFRPSQISLYNASKLWRRLKTEQSIEFARSVHNMSIALRGLGEYPKALASFEQSKAIRVTLFGENSIDVAKSYNGIGVVLSDMGRYKESLAAYEKSAQISLALNGGSDQSLDVFNAYMNIGGSYYEMKKLRDAEAYFEKCLPIVANLKDNQRLLASLYNNLGSVYLSMKDYARAVQYHEQALALRIGLFGELHPAVAMSCANLGSAYIETNNLTKGLEINLKSLEIRQQLISASPTDIAVSYRNLGDIYGLMGKRDTCMEYYREAERIFVEQHGESHVYTGTVRSNIAAVLGELGRYDEALSKYRQSTANFVAIDGPKGADVQSNLISTAVLYRRMGNLPAALRTLDTVLTNIGWPAQLDSIDSDQRFNLFETLLFKGEIMALRAKSPSQRTQPRELLRQAVYLAERYRDSLSTADSQTHFTTLVKRAIESSIRLEMSTPNRDDAQLRRVYELAAKNKAFLLYEAVAKASASLAHVPPHLVKQEADLRTDIAYYEKLCYQMEQSDSLDDQQAARQYAAEAFRLRREYEAFLMENTAHFERKESLPSVTARFVQDSVLAPGQTLLEYFVGDSSTYIFVIRKDTFVVDWAKNDFPLDSLVKTMLRGITEHFKDEVTANSVSDLIRTAPLYTGPALLIYQKMVKQVEPLLTRRVLVIPDGALGYVPFDALLKSRSPKSATRFMDHVYWGQSHIISYAYSANLLHQMQRKQSKVKAKGQCLVAAPFSDNTRLKWEKGVSLTSVRDSLGRLEYSDEEARLVARLLGTKPSLGLEASKAFVMAQMEQCAVVHFITHGKANFSRGEYAYLGFSVPEEPEVFEKLYVREIYNRLLDMDLAVLSACETGTGELRLGEGIISISRAFAYAGAKSITTTLWKVDDESTTKLMQLYYENLLQKRLAKDEALWQARQDYLLDVQKGGAEKAAYAHPFFWASFVPIGDMGRLR